MLPPIANYTVSPRFVAAIHGDPRNQTELAVLGGLTQSAVSIHLSGKPFGPKIKTKLVAIAAALGLSEDEAIVSGVADLSNEDTFREIAFEQARRDIANAGNPRLFRRVEEGRNRKRLIDAAQLHFVERVLANGALLLRPGVRDLYICLWQAGHLSAGHIDKSQFLDRARRALARAEQTS